MKRNNRNYGQPSRRSTEEFRGRSSKFRETNRGYNNYFRKRPETAMRRYVTKAPDPGIHTLNSAFSYPDNDQVPPKKVVETPKQTPFAYCANPDFPFLGGSKECNTNQLVDEVNVSTNTQPVNMNMIKEFYREIVENDKNIESGSEIERMLKIMKNVTLSTDLKMYNFGWDLKEKLKDYNLITLADIMLRRSTTGSEYRTALQINDFTSDVSVPLDYLTNEFFEIETSMILQKHKLDVWFYLYYANIGEYLQMLAAASIAKNGWRFHKQKKIWINLEKYPDLMNNDKAEPVTDRFNYFNMYHWKDQQIDLQISPSDIENFEVYKFILKSNSVSCITFKRLTTFVT